MFMVFLWILAQAQAASAAAAQGGFTPTEYVLGGVIVVLVGTGWAAGKTMAAGYRAELLENARRELESAAALATASAKLEAAQERIKDLDEPLARRDAKIKELEKKPEGPGG